MDMLTPFPSDVDAHVHFYVGRWYVIVRYWESLLMANDTYGIVMMRPFKSYADAQRFIATVLR
jgi:hypothetical protein